MFIFLIFKTINLIANYNLGVTVLVWTLNSVEDHVPKSMEEDEKNDFIPVRYLGRTSEWQSSLLWNHPPEVFCEPDNIDRNMRNFVDQCAGFNNLYDEEWCYVWDPWVTPLYPCMALEIAAKINFIFVLIVIWIGFCRSSYLHCP